MAASLPLLYVTSDSPLPGGEKLIRGVFTPTNEYASGGMYLNLTNYMLSTSYPTVICSRQSGYLWQHDGGTASAGKIVAYQNVFNETIINETATNHALYEAHDAADLSSVNVAFYACGKQY